MSFYYVVRFGFFNRSKVSYNFWRKRWVAGSSAISLAGLVVNITKDVTLRGFDYEYLESEEYTLSEGLHAICMPIKYEQASA